jgi:DNA-binding SARP family transcriptional activator
MGQLQISLLGGFQVHYYGQMVAGLEPAKVQELFAYLLLFQDAPHPRETLAGLLWGDSSTAQSKRYLRQALWQLNTGLDGLEENLGRELLSVDLHTISINPEIKLDLDVAGFEQSYERIKGVSAMEMDETEYKGLQDGVAVYRGDLLEGWYQDWCLFKREQLQNMYISMLERLMGYCEIHQQYEAGVAHGAAILRCDQAREHTHQGIMRLLYLSGDRTGALRQFERCTLILKEELNVQPSKSTIDLHQQILDEKVLHSMAESKPIPGDPVSVSAVLSCLKKFQGILDDMQQQLKHEISKIERTQGQK